MLADLSMGRGASNVPMLCLWCVDAADSVLFAESNFVERREIALLTILPPWTDEPKPSGITLQPQAFVMAASPSGRYLAVGYAGGLSKAELWDLAQKDRLLEIAHRSAVCSVAFTPDERILFTMSSDEIVATDLGRRERAAGWQIDNGRSMDVHPSGKTVAFVKQDGISVFTVDTGNARAIRLGHYQDLAGLREYLLGQLRHDMEVAGSDWVSSQVRKTLQQLGVPEDSIVGRRIREETEKSIEDVRSGRAFEHLGERTFQAEGVSCVKFVGAGKYLACVTEKALRVFDTDRVLSASNGQLEPLYSFQPPGVPCEHGALPGHVYALVDDAEKSAVLFGGLDGTIRSLDLATGEVSEWFSPPGTPPIMQMQIARNNLLFCVCQPGFPETHGRRQSLLLQIWDRDKLPR